MSRSREISGMADLEVPPGADITPEIEKVPEITYELKIYGKKGDKRGNFDDYEDYVVSIEKLRVKVNDGTSREDLHQHKLAGNQLLAYLGGGSFGGMEIHFSRDKYTDDTIEEVLPRLESVIEHEVLGAYKRIKEMERLEIEKKEMHERIAALSEI